MTQKSTSPPLEAAREKTGQVKEQLEVTSAELSVVNGALERHVRPAAQPGDVAWALDQAAAAERKVQQAAEELEVVTELLDRARSDCP